METLKFEVTSDEASEIRAQAEAERKNLVTYLRSRAIPPKNEESPVRIVRCKFTGARIFEGLPGAPPLTNESVKEMLSDFP